MLPSRKNWTAASCLYMAGLPLAYSLDYVYQHIKGTNSNIDLYYYLLSSLLIFLFWGCYLSLSIKPQKVHFQRSAILLIGSTIISSIQSEPIYTLILFVYFGFFYKLIEKDAIEKNKRGRSRH